MFTFLMGVTLAVGVIGIFNDYKEDLVGTAEKEESSVISSNIQANMFELNSADRGLKNIDIPQNIGGKDYTVSLNENISIITFENNYKNRIIMEGSFEGTTDSSKISIEKKGEEFVLRG